VPEPIRVMALVTAMETGGMEVYLVNTLSAIDRQKFQVSIVCTGRDSNWYADELESMGVKTYFCANPFTQISYIKRISKLMCELGTDVVCDFRNDFAAPTLLAAERLGIRGRIAMYRSTLFGYAPTLARRVYVSAMRWGVKRWATRIAANSARTLDLRYPGWSKDPRCSVVYNGVNLDRFSPEADGADIRQELGLARDNIAIGHVGRFHVSKNHAMLLDAFARVHARLSKARLILVGDGDLRPEIESQIARLSLQDCVTVLGRRQDVHRVLAAVDLFCFPSRYEGQPNALIEAAAAGKAFVASNIREVAEILPESLHKYLVDVDDPDACAQQLIALCEDEHARQRAAAAARQFAEQGFSLPAAADRLCDLWTADLTPGNQ
jgi:glycosyltransferase involved in cell wall biosynthesis